MRQFVDPHLADEAAQPGDARVILLRPLGPVLFGIGAHGTQLDQREGLAIQAHPRLPEKGRPLAVELHKSCKQHNDRQGQQQQREAGGNIKDPLHRAGKHPRTGKAIGKDQPAGVDRVQVDTTCFAFQKARQFIHMNACCFDTDKVIEGQSFAPLLEGQDHLARIQQRHMLRQVFDMGAINCRRDDRLAVIHGNMSNDNEACSTVFGEFADARGAGARTQYEHTALKALAPQHIAQDGAGKEQRDEAQPHRVERVRAPKRRLRKNEIDDGEKDDAKRDCDQQSRSGKSQRKQGIDPINPNCHHRELEGNRKGQQWPNARQHRLDRHANLARTDHPSCLSGAQ